MSSSLPSRASRRLAAAVAVGTAVVLVATSSPGGLPSAVGSPGASSGRAPVGLAHTENDGHSHAGDDGHSHAGDDEHGHDHGDASTKNALSRSTDAAKVVDPTTPQQARLANAAAEQQRAQAEPPLTRVPVSAAQPDSPTDRYNMFNACYGLQSSRTGRWLTSLTTPAFTATSLAAATPLYFKPTELGRYLLHSPQRTYLDAGKPEASYAATPGASNDWTVTMPSRGLFRFQVPGRGFLVEGAASRATVGDGGTLLRLRKRTGCTAFPEISTNITGNPHAGASRVQEVRGYIDAHTHGMAYQFLGGEVHCGRPWSPYGVPVALRDCPDHEETDGKGAAMEAFLSGKQSHDPVGWPTFKDWPAPHSLTHEGTYYKWMERSWRGGQRILVNLLVENNKLCEIYPLKRNSCDDMDSVRLQARNMRELERYVDAQHGGPGRGWYRIVTTPEQARTVINAGKMAVVMGIETSIPFGCTQKLGVPACSAAEIERQLDEVRKMGVSQMELVNKFDNALSGVAGDSGATGYLVNSANTLETGSPWRMQTCNPNVDEIHDKDQDNAVPIGSGQIPAQDALFGAVAKFSGVLLPAVPVYPAPHHCNQLGLTDLGAQMIRGLAKRHMLFDPDHMSLKGRLAALSLIEKMKYSGVLSSHSWSTPDAYPRILRNRGFIAPYAGDSNGFVAKWRRHLDWVNPRTYWGIGFGADINGLGAQGDPRPDAAKNPVTYPFTGIGGVTVHKQVSGQRVYDINKDGVSHYGLYPDWVEDLRKQAGSAIVKDLARGSEAYLQTWERAYGIRNNACAYPAERLTKRAFTRKVRRGMTAWQTLRAVGQPQRRLGSTFTYCATKGGVKVKFSPAGKVVKVVKVRRR